MAAPTVPKVPNRALLLFFIHLRKGTALVLSGAGAPTDNSTGNGTAKYSDGYYRTGTSKLYLNVGTKASTLWKLIM